MLSYCSFLIIYHDKVAICTRSIGERECWALKLAGGLYTTESNRIRGSCYKD